MKITFKGMEEEKLILLMLVLKRSSFEKTYALSIGEKQVTTVN